MKHHWIRTSILLASGLLPTLGMAGDKEGWESSPQHTTAITLSSSNPFREDLISTPHFTLPPPPFYDPKFPHMEDCIIRMFSEGNEDDITPEADFFFVPQAILHDAAAWRDPRPPFDTTREAIASYLDHPRHKIPPKIPATLRAFQAGLEAIPLSIRQKNPTHAQLFILTFAAMLYESKDNQTHLTFANQAQFYVSESSHLEPLLTSLQEAAHHLVLQRFSTRNAFLKALGEAELLQLDQGPMHPILYVLRSTEKATRSVLLRTEATEETTELSPSPASKRELYDLPFF